MGKVICVGCGLMGSNLIRAFMEQGNEVAIVNRTKAKADPFVEKGAKYFPVLSEAIRGFDTDLIVMNLDVYDNDEKVLKEAGELVKGKIIVNLTTGSADRVAAFDELVKSMGGRYIDGVITCYPKNIGAGRDGSLCYAGDRKAYEEAEEVLSALSPANVFVSEDPTAAPVMDTAWLSAHYGLYWGMIQAAVACENAGISTEYFVKCIQPMISALMGVICPNLLNTVGKNTYGPATDASLDIQVMSIREIEENFVQNGMDGSVLHAIGDVCEKAAKLGFGASNIEAMAKAIKEDK